MLHELVRTVARLLDGRYAFVTVADDRRSHWKAAHGLGGTWDNPSIETRRLIRAERAAATHHLDPAAALVEVDLVARSERRDPGRFATVAYLNIDVARPATIIRASAGHPPLLLRDPDGTVRSMEDANGTPIGIRSTVRYTTAVVDLPPGGVILLYTDGATDARSPSGEPLGEKRLAELTATAPAISATSLIDYVADGILAHAEVILADDIALMAILRRPAGCHRARPLRRRPAAPA